ncbi:MAG: hypothetical protein ABSG25_00155 [Bryobacteraceae bacterium]|jgi:hypothetical protein
MKTPISDLPQQSQTLSIRINEALRKRLEDIRRLAAMRKGGNVSTSEIAKQLLEAAREQRIEVVDLLSRPTEALVEIRRKGEGGHPLSRAEWTVLAYFVQQGAEVFSKSALSRESWIGILKAFQSVYELRAGASGEDAYYLGNLPNECQPERDKPGDRATPDLVRKTVAATIRAVNNPATKWTPTMAARNLYVFLDEEKLSGVAALNEKLKPYWPVLWRVAARGHYFVKHEPVRENSVGREPFYRPTIPSIHQPIDSSKRTDDEENQYTLSFAWGEGNAFSMLLSFPGWMGPMYPISAYPKIAEFRAMLSELPKLDPPKLWDGEYFFGYVTEYRQARQYWFRAQANGITIGFSEQDWRAVQELFRKAWEDTDLKRSWKASSQEYGEL